MKIMLVGNEPLLVQALLLHFNTTQKKLNFFTESEVRKKHQVIDAVFIDASNLSKKIRLKLFLNIKITQPL